MCLRGRSGLDVVSEWIRLKLHQERLTISSRVPNRNSAVGVVLDVRLHLTLQRTDVRRVGHAGLDIVHDLVAGEEGERVGVVLERLDHSEDMRKVGLGVSGGRVRAVEVLVCRRGVDVEDDVDADGVEDGHALVVVEGRVEVIGADGVHAQVLHEGSVAKAFCGVAERVGLVEVCALAERLVVDAQDHEALVGDGVDEVLALCDDRVGSRDRCRERAEGDEGVGELDWC